MSLRVLFLILLIPTLAVCPALCQDEQEPSNASAEGATTGCVIPNVPGLKWADGMCTFIGSLNACLNFIGEKTTYQYLMGVSGVAFATRFFRDWSESSADAALNDDHPKAAMEAVGYSYTWATSGQPGPIIESIDRGAPAVGANLSGHGDWGIIAGYERSGETWLTRTYYDRSSAHSIADKTPYAVLVIGRKGKVPTTAENVRKSIKLAVEFGKGERKLDAKYAVGFEAYTAWIDALRSKRCQELTGKELEKVAYINAWLYNSLIDARHAGVAHLSWAAKTLQGEARAHCERAAALYQEQIDILSGARSYVRYPQTIKDGPKWSAEMRAYQIEALRQALEKDKAAVASLEKVLADDAEEE